MQGDEISPCRNPASEQAFDLAAEQHPTGMFGHVERLHPDAVTDDRQAAVTPVGNRDGEHPIEPGEEAEALLQVQPKQHLGVRPGAAGIGRTREFGGQFPVVVDLAVLDDGDHAVVRDEGLVAAGQVDDRQALIAQTQTVGGPQGGVIRPAVANDSRHVGEQLAGDWASGGTGKGSDDSAHGDELRFPGEEEKGRGTGDNRHTQHPGVHKPVGRPL